MGLNQSESARIGMNRNVQSVSSCQAAGMMEPPRRVKNKKSQKEGVPDRLPMNFAPSETLKRLLMCEGTGKQMRLWASEYVRIMPEFDGSVRVTRLTRPTIQHTYSYLPILLYFVHFPTFHFLETLFRSVQFVLWSSRREAVFFSCDLRHSCPREG
mgnify:CR=1 FL=1